jgi:hypothetical protein
MCTELLPEFAYVLGYLMFDYAMLNLLGTGVLNQALSSVSCSCDCSASAETDKGQVWPFSRTSCGHYAHG